MSDHMSPLDIGVTAAGVVALVVAVAISAVSRRYPGRGTSWHPARGRPLPRGAEAALLSILEAVPDPRNHLALTRDLSGEVRITDADREAYEARRGRPLSPRPLSAEVSRFLPSPARDAEPVGRRRRALQDRPDRDASLVLTGQLFDDA
jgi:hypothetical protein